MQSLLLERRTGNLSPFNFATTVAELQTSCLKEVKPNIFPDNCHNNAAVNALAVETLEHRYMISGCADSSLKLWDLNQSPDEQTELPNEGDHNDLNQTSSPESSACYRLKAIATVPRRVAHKFGVSAVKWWPLDTGMFITASFDHTVKIWDTNNVEIVHEFDMLSRVYSIDVSAHQENRFSSQALIAVASDQPFVRLLDLRSASSAHTLPGHKGKTLSVAWHPQNSFLLASGGHDGEGKVWDIRMSNSCVARLDMTKTNIRSASDDILNLTSSVKAHLGPVNALVWDELGHILYTAGNDDKIRVWDMISSNVPPINKLVNFGPLTRNKFLQSLPLVLSPRSETEVQHITFASDNGDILVFRALDGKLITRLQRSGSKGTVRSASIVYSGPSLSLYLCGSMDGEIIAWRGQLPQPHLEEVGEYKEALNDFDSKANIQSEETLERLDLYDDPYFKYNLEK